MSTEAVSHTGVIDRGRKILVLFFMDSAKDCTGMPAPGWRWAHNAAACC